MDTAAIPGVIATKRTVDDHGYIIAATFTETIERNSATIPFSHIIGNSALENSDGARTALDTPATFIGLIAADGRAADLCRGLIKVQTTTVEVSIVVTDHTIRDGQDTAAGRNATTRIRLIFVKDGIGNRYLAIN